VSQLLDARPRRVVGLRPRVRSVGIVHVVSAAVTAGVLAFGDLQGCFGGTFALVPAGLLLVTVLGLSGASMVARLPRTSAVAPALSAGAATLLLGGGVSGWLWLAEQPCVGNLLDREFVTVLLVSAAAVASLGTSFWLLRSRDELEPWYGTRGVVVATAAAATVLVAGVGYDMFIDSSGGPGSMVATIVIPWAVVGGVTGWLRPSPAMAIAAPAVLQGLYLLAR